MLLNTQKDIAKQGRFYNILDACSSAAYFDGWKDDRWKQGQSPPRGHPEAPGHPVAEAHTWLLRAGWRRHGRIGVDEVPAAGRSS